MKDARDPRHRSGRARWARRGLALLVALLGCEVVLRPIFWLAHGRDPYYLFYGFQGAVGQVAVSPWSVYEGRHYKYPPHYELRNAAGQADEVAHTNALGFRGADFAPAKPAGTFRVVCLGGSSTFGFHNADDETYPYLLQRLCDRSAPELGIEVVNAGFPYYNTAAIRELLEQELVGYAPDVLTLYTGYNDASWPLDTGPAVRLLNRLQEHSITCLALKRTVLSDKTIYRLRSKLGGGSSPADARHVEEDVERVAARLRANVEAIAALAAERGIALVIVRQPMTLRHERSAAASRTYAEEVEDVQRRLAAGEHLSEFDLRLLRHRRTVAELDDLARRHGLPLVDNIALVDERKDVLASWVHLTRPGNERLAEALFPVVARLAREARDGGAQDGRR